LDKYNEAMRSVKKSTLSVKKLTLLFLVLFSFPYCDIDTGTVPNNAIKIYSGSYGYDIAYRIIDNMIYSGNYGYDVAYRIDSSKIYSGSYGHVVAYRINGNKVYSGAYGYEVAYRIDGDKIYYGSYGY